MRNYSKVKILTFTSICQASMDTLSTDIVGVVLSFLPVRDVLRSSRVCKKFLNATTCLKIYDKPVILVDRVVKRKHQDCTKYTVEYKNSEEVDEFSYEDRSKLLKRFRTHCPIIHTKNSDFLEMWTEELNRSRDKEYTPYFQKISQILPYCSHVYYS